MATKKTTPSKTRAKKAPPAAAAHKVAAAAVRPSVAEVVVEDARPLEERLAEVFHLILCDYAEGMSLKRSIVKRIGEGHAELRARHIIAATPEYTKQWQAVKEHRARIAIETATDVAMDMATGFIDREAGAKMLITIASKINPREWGDKTQVELTGKDGGDLKSTVTLSPGDAYRKMCGLA